MTDDHWACFKAKNSNQVWGYAKKQIDLTTPTITLTQNNNTITASGTGLTDFAYFVTTNSTSPTCDSTKTTGWTDGSTTSAMTDDHWACFKAKNSNQVWGYAKKQIDLTTPTITLTQNNNTITASGTGLTDFAYFVTTNSTSPTCDSTKTTGWTDGSTTSAMTDDYWACFKAKNSNQVWGYAKKQIDLTAPTITLTQNNNTITASGTGLTDFAYFVTTNSTSPTCDSTKTTGWTDGSTTSAMTDDYWACFKAKNSNQVWGYAKKQIDLTTPTITLTQNNNTITASGTGLTDFAYFVTTNSTSPTCDSTKTTGWTDGSTTSAMTDDHWACFKAKNSNQVWGYAKKQIDLTTPTITLTQNNNTITASGTGLTDFAYFVTTNSTSPTCDSTKTTGWTDGSTTSAMTDDYWACFKAKNSNQVWGYAKKQIDLTTPTITLTQNNNTITASGTGLSGQAYFTSSSNPTCDSTKTTGWTDGSTTSAMTDDYWACFKAKNSNQVWGYAKKQIDLTAPTITLTQNNNTITASGTGLTDFAYFVTTNSTSPTCDSTKTTGWTDGSTTPAMTDDYWACFKAKNSNQVWGYAKKQIDLTTPTITLTQNNNTITASGTGLTDFAYFVTTNSTSPTCDSTKTTGWTDGSTTSAMTDDYWACFKAKNSNQVWGYAKKQIDLTTPTITLTQNNNTITASGTGLTDFAYFVTTNSTSPTCDSTKTTGWTDGSTTSAMTDDYWACFKAKNSNQVWGYAKKQIDLTTPTITLTQNNNTITASGTGLTDFAYFVTTNSTSPTCDSTKTTGWTDGSTTPAMTDDYWACFKAKNSNQVWGYAKKQIDLTTPTITLTQNNNTITASGTGLTDFAYFVTTNSTSPTCDSTKTTGWTDGSTTSAMTDDYWACFKAKNSNQVWGYAKKQIDLTTPTITLTQNNNTITASGTGLSGQAYFTSSSNPTCDSTKTTGWTDGSTTSAMTDDHWACFKAKNSNQVWGYAKKQIDLTTPTITLTQNNNTITASGTGLSGQAYFTSSSNPTCDSTKTTGWTDGSTTSAMTDDYWACFKAKNSNQVWGYAKKQIDLTISLP